jgi:hypothetical protein
MRNTDQRPSWASVAKRMATGSWRAGFHPQAGRCSCISCMQAFHGMMARRERVGNGPNQPMCRVRPHPLSPQIRQRPLAGALVLQCRWFERVGYVRLVLEPHPRAKRSGQPFGCPNSFLTNLSNQRLRPHHPSPPDTTKAPCGALVVSGGESGIRTHDGLVEPPGSR